MKLANNCKQCDNFIFHSTMMVGYKEQVDMIREELYEFKFDAEDYMDRVLNDMNKL